MAKILDFVRRPAAPAPAAGAGARGAARGLLDRGDAADRRQGRRLPRPPARRHPGLRRPHRRHRLRRHARPPPAAWSTRASRSCRTSRPAASPPRAELDARIAAYADVGVRRGAGDRRRHRPPARPLLRGAAAPAHRPLRRPRLHPPARRRPPRGQPRHRPRRRRRRRHGRARAPRPPSPRETDAAMAIATQFVFEAAPVIAWADRARARPASPCRVHIGVAGPAKLQTLLKFAMACGVGPSLRVLQRRAADLTKLMLPFEPTASSPSSPPTRPRNPTSPIARVHFFPLGGIGATTDYAGALARARAARGATPGMTPAIALLFDLDGTLVDTDHLHHAAFVEILAERGRELTARRVPRPHHGPAQRRTSSPASSPARTRRSSTARRPCSATPRRQRRARPRHPRAARLGRGQRRRRRRRHQRPARQRLAMLAAAGLAHRLPTLVIGDECARPKPDPAPYQAAMAAARRHPVALRRLRGQPLRPPRRPRRRRPCLRHDHRPRRGRAPRRPAPTQPSPTSPTRPSGPASNSSGPASHDPHPHPHHRRIRDEDRPHRLRPAVLRHRRAHQPHRPQEARRRARGRRLLHRRGGRAASRSPAAPPCSTSTPASSTTPNPQPERDRAAADAADGRARSKASSTSRSPSTARVPGALAGRPRDRARPPARQLRHRRGGAPRARPAAGQEVRRPRRRHLQRRHRHLRGPRRPLRGGEEDRPPRRRLRHPRPRHRRRPAGHADRRHGDRRPAGLRPRPPPARGARRQHHLRRLQHLLRPAEPPRHQRRLPADGDRLRHDQRRS